MSILSASDIAFTFFPALTSAFSTHYGSKQGDIETSKFPLSHELGSERSERASERMSGAERVSEAKRAVRSK